MKKIINAIKDFMYNITDYGLIIIVITVMVVILSWRFDILFNKGIEKKVIAELPQITEPDDNNIPDDINEPEKPEPTEPTETEEPVQTENPSDNEGSGIIATVDIPEGSFPSKIGDILINSNLIDDKEEFLSRSVELGLDTRLRSGIFEIEVGTSLDNIIKIIANAR